MRPLNVVTLIILGSSFAIMFSLLAVVIVVLFADDESGRLQPELAPLLRSLVIFVGMTAISAASFYSLLKIPRAKVWLQAAMWLGVLAVGWYFWV